ncbi:MAG TPA: class I SAM-dependent methyltransferase [Puia sp.]|nr:class I SAM-dependent methyltransferase [Puia sp.]
MDPASNWFLDWFNSPYYHQLYHYRDEREAELFLNNLLIFLKPARDVAMLDVACGRGRHARILASRGFDVVGIDISPAMIAYAKQFEDERLHFYQHDMRLPFWINYFDHAFNFFTSFGYFKTEREHLDALRSIAKATKPNGRFILDFLNVVYAERNIISESEQVIDGVSFHQKRHADIKHLFKYIAIEDHKLHRRFEFVERIAKFSLDDFSRLFHLSGLEIMNVFGSYNLEPFDLDRSTRLIMIAKKR